MVSDHVLLPVENNARESKLECIRENIICSFNDILSHVHPEMKYFPIKKQILLPSLIPKHLHFNVSYPKKGIISLSPKHFLIYSLFLVSAVGWIMELITISSSFFPSAFTRYAFIKFILRSFGKPKSALVDITPARLSCGLRIAKLITRRPPIEWPYRYNGRSLFACFKST